MKNVVALAKTNQKLTELMSAVTLHEEAYNQLDEKYEQLAEETSRQSRGLVFSLSLSFTIMFCCLFMADIYFVTNALVSQMFLCYSHHPSYLLTL